MSLISEQIKKLRTQMNQTQQEFGESIESNVKTISAYETGRAVPPLAVLLRISNYCKVSLDFLAKGKEFVSNPRIPKDASLAALLKKAQKAPLSDQKKMIQFLSNLK